MSAMDPNELVVLTYNILHDLPLYHRLDRRLEIIGEAIAAAHPQVAALQEVARARLCGDVGQRLCALTNRACGRELFSLLYARTDGAGEGEFAFDEGVALMSRMQMVGAHEVLRYDAQVRLATEFGGHRYRLPDDRVAMRARYRRADGCELEVCVTHLTDRTETVDGLPVRTAQARELARWLKQRADPRCALVVAGDFNDVPDSETVRAMTEAGFIDLWGAAGAGPGYTNDRNDFALDKPDATPNQRIDYLFLRPGAGQHCEISEVALFLDRPHREPDVGSAAGGWLWASDHIGVIARLKL